MVQELPSIQPVFPGDSPALTFEQIFKKFKPDIRRLASTYPKAWREDFCQEGAIALFDAHQKFIILPKERDFRPYALKSIKRRMIDFHRKTIDRALPIIENPSTLNEDFEEEDLIYNLSVDPDFFSSITFGIDHQILFSRESLRARGFSETEIDAFHLHFEKDLMVTDVASVLKISIGQASKIIAKVRARTERLIKDLMQ